MMRRVDIVVTWKQVLLMYFQFHYICDWCFLFLSALSIFERMPPKSLDYLFLIHSKIYSFKECNDSDEDVPRVSQGSFFHEQMSSPVSRMAWSWRWPSWPPRVDCHWQKLFSVWSAWWLITNPSWDIRGVMRGMTITVGLHKDMKRKHF